MGVFFVHVVQGMALEEGTQNGALGTPLLFTAKIIETVAR